MGATEPSPSSSPLACQLYVGVDIGKAHHWVCLLDDQGRVLLFLKVANDEGDLTAVIEEATSSGAEITRLTPQAPQGLNRPLPSESQCVAVHGVIHSHVDAIIASLPPWLNIGQFGPGIHYASIEASSAGVSGSWINEQRAWAPGRQHRPTAVVPTGTRVVGPGVKCHPELPERLARGLQRPQLVLTSTSLRRRQSSDATPVVTTVQHGRGGTSVRAM